MFSDIVIAYLFLGGAGAGAGFVASTLALLSPAEQISTAASACARCNWQLLSMPPTYRRFLAAPMLVALFALFIGLLCLVADLGNPSNIVCLLLSTRISWATVGAYALGACVAFLVLQLLSMLAAVKVPLVLVRALQVLTAAASFVVMLYTGMLLYSMAGIAFWHTAALPALFVLSSLSCGIALVILSSVLFRMLETFATVIFGLLRVDAVVIAAEAAVLVAFFLLTQSAQGEGMSSAAASAQTLLVGDLAAVFWVLFVALGIAAPFVGEVLSMALRRQEAVSMVMVPLVLTVCVLIGGAAMRYCIVQAAIHPFLGGGFPFASLSAVF